jgi:anhydro-N-acetylmuramic acid kinase
MSYQQQGVLEKAKKKEDKLSMLLRKNLQRRKMAGNIKTKKESEIGELFIGYMSGTSCDGVDASLVRTDGENAFTVIANTHIPYPWEFKSDLKKLCSAPILPLEIEKKLTEFHIEATKELLKQTKYSSQDIRALGFHGQTIFHKPESQLTWQIGNPHMLAQNTGIDVVHDFRRRDISLGGQGAPLVPIFHKLLMQNQDLPVAVINIGGVANITYINHEELIGFDTGPGNALIDDAMNKYFNEGYDKNGVVASTGKIDESIVSKFLINEYFKLPYPKSLDRNSFKHIMDLFASHSPQDIVATLTYITCATIIHAIQMMPITPVRIFLCGGGSKNKQIVEWLKSALLENGLSSQVKDISSIDSF